MNLISSDFGNRWPSQAHLLPRFFRRGDELLVNHHAGFNVRKSARAAYLLFAPAQTRFGWIIKARSGSPTGRANDAATFCTDTQLANARPPPHYAHQRLLVIWRRSRQQF